MFLLLLNIVVDGTLYLHVLTWIFLHAGSVDPSSYVKEDPPSLRYSKCIKQCIANGLTSTYYSFVGLGISFHESTIQPPKTQYSYSKEKISKLSLSETRLQE